MTYEAELAAALDAALTAGRWLAEEYRRFTAIPDAPADISTEADRTSQEIILKRLRDEFPSDAFCAEEETPTLAASSHSGPRIWIIDPIDGTRGFARKNGEFSVMVAFVDDGTVAAGVVYEPARERLTYARRGGGCFVRDGAEATAITCRTAAVASLATSTLTQTHSRRPDVASPAAALLQPARVIESYSAGIKLALVARGEADLYVNTYRAFHDWDICAGDIVVTEAGGQVTGLHGETLTYGAPQAEQRHGLLASNGRLHDAAVERLRGLQTG